MRFLFTFAGGAGHADPLVPVARAVGLAGHAVAFSGRASVTNDLAARGFVVFGDASAIADPPPQRLPLAELDPEREDLVLRYGFADRIARARAAGIAEVCSKWRPDVVVHDEVDFGAAIAAERLGIPHATVLVVAAGSFVRSEIVAESLDVVRADLGLAADPDLVMLRGGLVLSPFPPSFRDPAFPLPAGTHSFRPDRLEPVIDAPAYLSSGNDRPDTPTVYFTLGTIFNLESGDLFTRVLTGLRELPIEVVVTVGRNVDTDEVGPQPVNVHIERFIPQSMVLPYCDLVVSHGGSGSVVGALAHGLPQVVLPMGADQPLNAARIEALGVGRTLDARRATSEMVRSTVESLFAHPGYASAAQRVQSEIDALPGPESTVARLERM
ncbi:MAG: hypothetical protein QOJ71_2427 [Actinomycetota bacterium]|nr:hypothetical protein [Actinomycetota bacterium]